MAIVQRGDGEHPADFGCAQAGCAQCLERLLQQHEGDSITAILKSWEHAHLHQALEDEIAD